MWPSQINVGRETMAYFLRQFDGGLERSLKSQSTSIVTLHWSKCFIEKALHQYLASQILHENGVSSPRRSLNPAPILLEILHPSTSPLISPEGLNR